MVVMLIICALNAKYNLCQILCSDLCSDLFSINKKKVLFLRNSAVILG